MKHTLSRALSLLCCLAMLLTLLPTAALAASPSHQQTQTIADGLSLTASFAAVSGGTRQMYRLDYTPGAGVQPMVAYGSKLYGKSDVNYVTRYVENQGHTVMAAVNADFFHTDTGVPTGMVINNGRLCVSDGSWNAVGFFADGTAICGTPELRMSLIRANGSETPIYGLNKVRTTAGLYLYSEDFSSTTHTTAAGTEVVLQAMDGDVLQLGRGLRLTVVSNAHTANTPIGKNQFVLSLTDANVPGLSVSDLQPGEEVYIYAATKDPIWHDAVYACGGGDLLARNGALTAAATASSPGPRTVLGVRKDGSFSVIVCDGRQTGLANGLTLKAAAQQLLELGCSDIINLDGGGSSILSARQPGQAASAVQSSPADGSPRKCANYIVFVNTGDRTLPETGIAVYPQDAAVLSGAAVSLSAHGFNDDYYPSGNSYTDCFYIREGSGSISGNTYYAPAESGTVSIAAAAGGLICRDALLEVVDQPSQLRLVKSGSTAAVTALSLSPGERVDLNVYATDGLRRLVSQDSQFIFSVTGGIGTVDENGIFTAGSGRGLSGTVTASYGNTSASVRVTVGKAPTVLEGFEGTPAYTATAALPNSRGTALVSSAPENARYGTHALQLTYGAVEADLFTFAADRPLPLPSGATHITLLARGSGNFALLFAAADGSTAAVPLTLSGSGWNFVTAAVPDGAKTIAGFVGGSTAAVPSGSIFVDQLMCHFGGVTQDTTPPVISSTAYENGIFSAIISDDAPLPITADRISLQVDGADVSFQYSADLGILSAALPQTGDLHHMTLTVRDHFHNTAFTGMGYGTAGKSVFSDLKGHWGYTAAEYLCSQGIFSADSKFNPQNKVTNEMAATLMSRYLQVDTAAYADVQLPYGDTGRISGWALPHVKAMYAMGIMIGGTDSNGIRVFNPAATTTRAQVMTLLGRTISRGYTYSSTAFSDASSIPAWAADHVNLLYSMGIVKGYTTGGKNLIKPLDTITRAEFASLLYQIY